MDETSGAAALWWAVVASGLYHGVNPGMGWPLAVSAALMDRTRMAMPRALAALAAGHFLSMLAILLPFSLLTWLALWEREIRWLAALLLIGLGLYLLVTRRHPRFLARVSPAKLGLWSFLAAIAHGAGLMLVPLYLGICATEPGTGHGAAAALMSVALPTALAVAVAHTAAMALAGSLLAVAVHRWFGLRAVSRTWFNLDAVWAGSLVLVGVLSLVLAG